MRPYGPAHADAAARRDAWQPSAPRSPAAPAGARRQRKPGSSLESRIGAQLLNRIGIFAVLIGVAWFLKLAFDRNWIGPPIRVLIGLPVPPG